MPDAYRRAYSKGTTEKQQKNEEQEKQHNSDAPHDVEKKKRSKKPGGRPKGSDRIQILRLHKANRTTKAIGIRKRKTGDHLHNNHYFEVL